MCMIFFVLCHSVHILAERCKSGSCRHIVIVTAAGDIVNDSVSDMTGAGWQRHATVHSLGSCNSCCSSAAMRASLVQFISDCCVVQGAVCKSSVLPAVLV
jgi:hypothetical protein